MPQRKMKALSRLDHDELLALARRISRILPRGKASAGDLVNLIGRSLSAEEIRREVREIVAQRKWRERWGRRLAYRRSILGLIVLVVVASSFYVVLLGSTPPQHYLVQTWGKTWAHGGNVTFSAGTVDADGDFYVTGSSTGYFLAKFSPMGVEEWRRNFTVGEGESIEVRSLVVDEESEEICCTGVTDVASFVMGLDSRGVLKWIRTWSGRSLISQTVIRNGAVYVGGSIAVSNHDTAYVIKYDSEGNELWNTTWSGGTPSFAHAIDIDDGGNVFMAGDFNGSQVSSVTVPHGFLAKYDSVGREVWNTTWLGVGYGAGRSVTVEGEYAYVLDEMGELRKYSTELGWLIWRKPLGEWFRLGVDGDTSFIEEFRVVTISVDSKGAINTAGVYLRQEERSNVYTYSYAFCLAAFNSDGEKIMNATSGICHGRLLLDTIVLQPDGSLYVVGWISHRETQDWEFVLMKLWIMNSFLAGTALTVGLASVACIILAVMWKERRTISEATGG